MPAGRPTKITPEVFEKAIDYINGGWQGEGDMIPSIQGMACALDVSERVIYDWGEKNEEFLQILQKCKTNQHNRLINGGLSGDMNPTICKLVLGKHGYHERQEVTGANGEPVKVDQRVSSVTFTGPDE